MPYLPIRFELSAVDYQPLSGAWYTTNQELAAADRRKPFSNLKLYFVAVLFPSGPLIC